jgi:uncharacterized protein (DUF433 family)
MPADGSWPAMPASQAVGLAVNERVVIDSAVCHGRPVIGGTRTAVAVIVGSLTGGMSLDEVMAEYDLNESWWSAPLNGDARPPS